MPRILFVHHRPHLGGAVRSLALLASALDRRWELHAIVPEGPAAVTLREAGLVVHPAPVPVFAHTWDVQYHGLRWLVFARELAWAPGHSRAFRSALRTVRPDLVHLNDSIMLLSGAMAARARLPVIWHLRSSLAHGGRDGRGRWLASRLDRYGTSAIAIDEDVAATFPLRIPIDVIPNPVSAPAGPRASLPIPEGRVAIGYVGYLRRQKGWPEFLEAIRLLRDADLPAHAVIVGEGIRPPAAFRGWRGRVLTALGVPDDKGDFDRRVRDLNLEDRVTSLPFLNDPAPVLRALDIIAFPNQGVGLGRPVLEAAAFGKAVVAAGSRTGGGILVPGETGILLESATPAALAEALRQLVVDGAARARMGCRAEARIAALASPRVHADSVAAAYERAIGSAGARHQRSAPSR